jgi:hypothetical protein
VKFKHLIRKLFKLKSNMRIAAFTVILFFTINAINAQSKECIERWANWTKMNELKNQYFEDSVLSIVLKDSRVSQENKRFLQEILWFIMLDWEEEAKLSVLEKPLFAIYEIYDLPLGVFSNTSWECEKLENGKYSSCWESGFEFDFFKKYNETELPMFIDKPMFIQLPKAFNQFVGRHELRVLNKAFISKTEIVNFWGYLSECLSIFNYEIERQDLSNALIGTYFDLDIEFKNFQEIDKALEDQSLWDCSDCAFSYEPEITFAKFPFIDNLFFTYTDTFNKENQYNEPNRSLIMRMNDGQLVTLWSDYIDLFGCSCL